MKRIIMAALLLATVFVAGAIVAAEPPSETAPAVKDTTIAADSLAADRIVVTYFHGDRRCATCMKLEAYSHEAIADGFADNLAAGNLEWRVVNFDEEANHHYTDDYKLFSQSLILSHVVDGKEVAWENLDKIWDLVNNKDQFVPYVQEMTREFMKPQSQE